MNPAAQQKPVRSHETDRLSRFHAALQLLPIVACLIVYWYGLRVWFQMDDFAWLNLHSRIHDVPSFLLATFQPLAQGTVRPWSERLYFLLGWELARMESAWILRTIAFLTQFANLLMLSTVTRRLTGGSRIAGAAAALLWVCNSNLYIPMAWSAAYNQLMCSGFLLGALLLWLRYADTGEQRWYRWQFLVFVLGFGALEINVVYPVLAALAAWCIGRRDLIRRTVPMFAVSAVYAIFHRLLAPKLGHDIYRMYFDTSLVRSLWTYLRWTFAVERYAHAKQWPVLLFQVAGIIAAIAFVGFVIIMLIRRERLPVFGIGWFFAALTPVLPLRNHVSDYYLTIPLIGLAIIGGWGISLAWTTGRRTFGVVVAIALLYLVPSALMARSATIRYYLVSQRVKTFVRSVAYADKLHPNQTLVIRHIDDDLFWAAWWDNPFQIFGRKRIYVSAEDEPHITPFTEMGSMSRYFLSEREALAGLQSGDVTAYELVPDGHLRNVSELYRETLLRRSALELPKYINFGSQESTAMLQDGWWQPEGNFRWSGAHAAFTIRGAHGKADELVLTGLCPRQQLEKGPLHLTLTIDGHRNPPSTVTGENLNFVFRYPMPESAVGKQGVEVKLDVERTLMLPGDRRALGLAIASAEVISPGK